MISFTIIHQSVIFSCTRVSCKIRKVQISRIRKPKSHFKLIFMFFFRLWNRLTMQQSRVWYTPLAYPPTYPPHAAYPIPCRQWLCCSLTRTETWFWRTTRLCLCNPVRVGEASYQGLLQWGISMVNPGFFKEQNTHTNGSCVLHNNFNIMLAVAKKMSTCRGSSFWICHWLCSVKYCCVYFSVFCDIYISCTCMLMLKFCVQLVDMITCSLQITKFILRSCLLKFPI